MAKRPKQKINEQKLELWINHGINVLWIGRHGTGKTTIVRDAFEQAGLNYKIYSCATLDPWVDFIGVPEKRVDKATGHIYLDLVRPKEWEDDSVEAIFLDEYNRSHKKIRNAVMELIQFKSINGKKFPNLKLVWAAVNPYDEEGTYDVERIDPAQEDRFQVRVFMPYEPNREYFTNKFGADMAGQSIDWWKAQTKDNQDQISPRRLDYALEYWAIGGDLGDVLPAECGLVDLRKRLGRTPKIQEFKKLLQSKDTDGMTEFLADEDNFMQVEGHIKHRKQSWEFTIPCMPEEKIAQLISDKDTVLGFCLDKLAAKSSKVMGVLEDIKEARADENVAGRIETEFQRLRVPVVIENIRNGKENPNAEFANFSANSGNEDNLISLLQITDPDVLNGTYRRHQSFKRLVDTWPNSITPGTAEQALDVLEGLISRSHNRSIKEKFKKAKITMVMILNECFKSLVDNDALPENFDERWNNTIDFASQEDGFVYRNAKD